MYQACGTVLRGEGGLPLSLEMSETAFCRRFTGGDMGYCFPELAAVNEEAAQDLPSGQDDGAARPICVQEVATGLHMPMFAVHAGDGTNR